MSRDQQRARQSPRLRPYQEECLDRIRARYREGARRLLVSLPTGTGKTVVFAAMPTFFEMKKRMLVLAHREELLEQAAAKFAATAPELTVGIEQGSRSAATYRRVFDHFELFAEGSKRLLVGFTATPRRGDNQALSEVFEEIAYARFLPEMVRDGYLCPIRGWRVHTSIDIAGVRVRHGDFVESDLAQAVDVPERNRLVVDSYERLAPG